MTWKELQKEIDGFLQSRPDLADTEVFITQKDVNIPLIVANFEGKVELVMPMACKVQVENLGKDGECAILYYE